MIKSIRKALFTSVLQIAALITSAQNSPPGKLVDVGGYKLHINSKGAGDRTIVIEAGTGSWSLHWMEFQTELAKHFRVVTYDRAGYGWSEPSPYARTARNIIEELYTGLEKAGVEGPFVLLGHSYGGMIAKAFVKKYPKEVEAVILADAASEYQFEKLPPMVNMMLEGGKQQFKQTGVMARSGMLTPEQMPVDSTLIEKYWRDYQVSITNAGYYDAMLNEMELLPMTYEISKVDTPLNLPLLVITAGDSFSAFTQVPNLPIKESNKVWMELQKKLLSVSNQSTQVIINGATHDLLLSAPEELAVEVAEFVKSLD